MPLITLDTARLKADGCQLADPPMLFIALCSATANDPCMTGCAYFSGGKCPAYLRNHSKPRGEDAARQAAVTDRVTSGGLIGGKWAGMSSKQIREKEGITREEFQSRKQRGVYAE